MNKTKFFLIELLSIIYFTTIFVIVGIFFTEINDTFIINQIIKDDKKPIIVKNQLNKEVVINQVGWAGLQLGKIDFYFDSAKSIVNTSIGANMYINYKES